MKDLIVQTVSGKVIDLRAIDPNQIDFGDIAHSLSMQCRYNGHVRTFYSVAEHSIIAAHLAAAWGLDAQQAVLMHDAAEAYIGDMVRPLKVSDVGAEFKKVESDLEHAIGERFEIDFEKYAREIKQCDLTMLAIERDGLIDHPVGEWPAEMPSAPGFDNAVPLGLPPSVARREFNNTAKLLQIMLTTGPETAPGIHDLNT